VRSLCLVALALLWTVVPVPAQMRTASRITVEEHEACSGLSTPQCCEQMVAYHGFRATGDQLSKRGQLTVRLLCGDKAQLASKASCKDVAISRGLAAKVAKQFCASRALRQKCEKCQFCSQCVDDLNKLGYSQPQWICYGATYVDVSTRPPQGPTVVELPDESHKPAPDGTSIVIKKRHLLR
jgi:hypothetical protein